MPALHAGKIHGYCNSENKDININAVKSCFNIIILLFYRSSRKSLKVLGTVGEPINPEAWLWYYHTVGDAQCSIVDTYWQTETVSKPCWQGWELLSKCGCCFCVLVFDTKQKLNSRHLLLRHFLEMIGSLYSCN